MILKNLKTHFVPELASWQQSTVTLSLIHTHIAEPAN